MPFQASSFIEYDEDAYSKTSEKIEWSITRRTVLPLLGLESTGKTWLLKRWLHGYDQAGHVLYIPLRRSRLRGESRSANTDLLLCFSRIAHQLNEQCDLTQYVESPDETEPKKFWTKDQYYRAYHRLLGQLSKHHIRAIIIDQAHTLSKDTWEELLELRADLDGKLALIPCFTLRSDETAEEHWKPFAEKLHRGDQQTSLYTMPTLTAEQFPNVLLQLCAQLQAMPDTTVLLKHKSIAAAWWPKILGNWHVIKELQAKIDHVLGPETTKLRTITMDVVRSISLDYMVEIG